MRRDRTAVRLTLFCVVSSVMAVSACSSSGSPSASTRSSSGSAAGFTVSAPASIKKAGVLNICADITYPPFTFIQKNKPAGFDVDMANDIAAAMGVRAKFSQTGFPTIIGALNGGKCDAIINGMSGSPEQAKAVAIVPYLRANEGVAVANGNPLHINTLRDLAGKSVATENSGLLTQLKGESDSLVQQGLKPIKIVGFTNDPSAFEAVITRKVDAIYQSSPVLAYYTKQFPHTIHVTDIALHSTVTVIGVRKNDTALIDTFKAAVTKMYKLGTVQKIAKSWGFTKSAYLGK